MLADEPITPAMPPSADDASDFQRMRRIRLGDAAAFAELMRTYWAPLVRYSAHLLGSADHAEDVAQETFVAVWKQRGRWEPTASPRSYLYGIARNVAYKEQRRRAVRHKFAEPIRHDVQPAPTPLEDAHRHELRSAVERAIQALPPRRREAFVLARYNGLSVKEIANIMQVSPQTVANQISAAFTDLRQSLQDFSD